MDPKKLRSAVDAARLLRRAGVPRLEAAQRLRVARSLTHSELRYVLARVYGSVSSE